MHKDQVADRLLTLARQDPAITGAALTGSHATGHADAWSDLDLVLAVHGDRTPVGWHHALHAGVCVERGRFWQAEHWIGALRAHLITLACLRQGVASAHAKGAHLVDLALEPTLVRSLDAEELLRALGAAAGVLATEVGHWDAGLAGRLGPGLRELAAR